MLKLDPNVKPARLGNFKTKTRNQSFSVSAAPLVTSTHQAKQHAVALQNNYYPPIAVPLNT